MAEQLKMFEEPDFIRGDAPAHEHRCSACNATWKCNSPYCTTTTTRCSAHGGKEAIEAGREPWGR